MCWIILTDISTTEKVPVFFGSGMIIKDYTVGGITRKGSQIKLGDQLIIVTEETKEQVLELLEEVMKLDLEKVSKLVSKAVTEVVNHAMD